MLPFRNTVKGMEQRLYTYICLLVATIWFIIRQIILF